MYRICCEFDFRTNQIQSDSILFGICLLISKSRRTNEGDGAPSKCPQYKQTLVWLLNVQLSMIAICSVIERLILFDCQLLGNRTFNFVGLTKFYCEFDCVRLPSPIERLVFDWVRLQNVRLDMPGCNQPRNTVSVWPVKKWV